jgi:hypothetical protein
MPARVIETMPQTIPEENSQMLILKWDNLCHRGWMWKKLHALQYNVECLLWSINTRISTNKMFPSILCCTWQNFPGAHWWNFDAIDIFCSLRKAILYKEIKWAFYHRKSKLPWPEEHYEIKIKQTNYII